MTIKKITSYNYKYKKPKTIVGKPMVEPGQTDTIEELVRKMNKGLPVHEDHRLIWAELEEMVPKFQDLTDIDAMNDHVQKTLQKFEEVKAALEAKKAEEKVEDKKSEKVAQKPSEDEPTTKEEV